MTEHPTHVPLLSIAFRLGGAIGMVAILGASARAAPRAPPRSSAPSGASEARLDAALAALNAGVDRFDADDVAGALGHFEAARDLAPDKARPYLWLGRAWVRLHRCDRALPALQQFLIRARPDHPDRPEAQAAARRCQPPSPSTSTSTTAALASRPEAPAQAPDPQRTALPSPGGGERPAVGGGRGEPAPPGSLPPAAAIEPPRSPAREAAPWPRLALRRAGIGLVVAGAALAIAGGVGFGVLARDRARDILQASARSTPFDRSVEDAGRLDQALSIASIAVGGAAAVAGTVSLALSGRVEAAARPLQTVALVPAAGPGFLGVAAYGAF